jgi:hypothetical protein
MAILYAAGLLPFGGTFWIADAVPSQAGDYPPGFVTQDLLLVYGANASKGSLYRCSAAGSPGTWKPFSVAEAGSGSFTNFATGGGQPAALTSTFVNATAGVVADLWVAAVVIPYSCTITGIWAALNANSGTDKALVSLFDGAGTLLANSALAGATITPTSMGYQKIPFVTPYAAVGPALHFIGVQTNGTTGQVGTQLAGVIPGGVITGQSSLVVPASITPPTTFTANQAPVAVTY